MQVPKHIFLLTVFFFCCSWAAGAATITDIIKDLQAIEGYVVADVNGEIIIDLGTAAGVHKGDLFTAFHPGKKLTDPVSGKLLGYIETPAGFIAVNRVEKTFSYARAVGKLHNVRRGDKVVRLKAVHAVTVDKTGNGTHFLRALRQGLPALSWEEHQGPATQLLFVREGNHLLIQDRQGKVIREYQLGGSGAAASGGAGMTPVFTRAAVAPAGGTVTGGQVRYDMQTYGYGRVGGLPFAALMGDFLVIDGKVHLVVIREHEVAVYRLAGKGIQRVAHSKIPLLRLLAVCWWQPAGNGPYIGVTGFDEDEQEVSSIIFSFKNRGLSVVGKDVPFILGSSDVDGDLVPETMLAQDFDLDTFFGRQISEIKLVGHQVRTSRFKTSLPSSFRVTGGVVYRPAAGAGLVAGFIESAKFFIYEGGRRVYESGKEMGGSYSSIRYVHNPKDINPLYSTANIEIRPLAMDIDHDTMRELLVPGADLAFMTTVGGSNAIKTTWVSVLKKNSSGSYMKGRIGGQYDQYIQGIGAAGNTLYLLTVKPAGMFAEGDGSSQILVLPIK